MAADVALRASCSVPAATHLPVSCVGAPGAVAVVAWDVSGGDAAIDGVGDGLAGCTVGVGPAAVEHATTRPAAAIVAASCTNLLRIPIPSCRLVAGRRAACTVA